MPDLKTPIIIHAQDLEDFERILRYEITLPDFIRAAAGRRGHGVDLDEGWADRLPEEYLRGLLDSGRLDDGDAMALAHFAARLFKKARTTA